MGSIDKVKTGQERRLNPRLVLSYPIEISVREKGRCGSARAVTTNLSARGAYFKTFSWADLREGGAVTVTVTVPHPLHTEHELLKLKMQTEGRICRMDLVTGREALGEDGLVLKGVAVKFDAPLAFDYGWG
jgi:hypothetical protein